MLYSQSTSVDHSNPNLTLGMDPLLPGLWLQQVGWGVRMIKQDFLSPIWYFFFFFLNSSRILSAA